MAGAPQHLDPSLPYVPPTCEDYHSDESDGKVLDSFTGRKSPAAANVSTKRSHPSDLDKEKPPSNLESRSDSGYSSYTAATVSSADSAPSASFHRSPAAPAATTAAPVASQSPASKPRRPTLSDRHTSNTTTASSHSTTKAPRETPLSRTTSTSSRRPSAPLRRPTITHDRRESRDGECRDANCTQCPPPTPATLLQRRRPDLPPSQSARNIHIPSDQHSIQSDPAAYYASPSSPTYTRTPAYMQGPAVVQPAPPRRRSSSTTRPRPMSYSGDPGAQYWASGMGPPYQSALDRGPGPPPSASAYRNMQQYQQLPHMPPYMGPQAGYYPPQYPNQTSAAFDMPRPDMPSRNSSYYGTRNQPPPLITQDLREKPVHSARYPQTKAPPQQLQLHDEPYESSGSECSSDEDYDQSRNSRALVTQSQPKPKRSKSQRRRPRLPHASTTTAVDRLAERRQSIVVPDPPKDRGRSSRTKTTTRGISASRPAAPPREIKSYESPTARVFVNSTKERRRQSTQVYDKMYEQYAQARAIEERLAKAKALEEAAHARAEEERRAKAELRAKEEQRAKEEYVAREMARLRLEQQYEAAQRAEQRIEQRAEERAEQKRQQKRASKVYYHQPVVFDDYGQEEEEEIEEPPMPLRSGRRRPTDVEGRRPRERDVETKSKTTAAEDYISAQRGSQSTYADQSYKVAKRASRIPSGPSESGSSRDEKQSLSARTVATNANNEIRLRVDASAPLSLSFNGDMEGRTLQLLPAENGMADIVIGNARGGEDTYHTSERSSIMGNNRRPLIANQARREAEEMTERSSRSSRSRRENREREIRDDREGPRQVLRRRTDYRH